MDNRHVETKEYHICPSKEVNAQSLLRRFGNEVVEKGIQKTEQIIPFTRNNNLMRFVGDKNKEDFKKHNLEMEIIPRRNEDILAKVVFKDSFSLPGTEVELRNLQNELVDELALIPNGLEKTEKIPPRIAELQKKLKEAKGLENWKLDTQYFFDNMDGWHTFDIILRQGSGKSNTLFKLELVFGCHGVIRIPLSPDFDRNLEEARVAAKLVYDWLEIPENPIFKYEFCMNEEEIERSRGLTMTKSTSFQEYFHNLLKDWDKIPETHTPRALIGYSKDGKEPILLLEDPSINIQSSDGFLRQLINGAFQETKNMPVPSHPQLYEMFQNAIRRGEVNKNLVNQFPDEKFDDHKWLHMFVQKDGDGSFVLVEDFSSNEGKNELVAEILDLAKEQYGIGYGGKFDLEKTEIEARRPMLMPKINWETEQIAKKYGWNVANRFRGYAISALILGNKQAHEKYASFEKLL